MVMQGYLFCKAVVMARKLTSLAMEESAMTLHTKLF
jgi:hypothetical protein